MKTKVVETPIKDLLVIELEYFVDERGFFVESWHKRDFAAAGVDIDFVQDSHSKSTKFVLRGLHYQNMTAPMAKLVRCTVGAIFDVAVDLRSKSDTFGKWFGVELSSDNKKQFLVPVGFAHGFAVLSDVAEVQYKQSGYYTPAAEGTISWNDPDVAVEWPVTEPVLSERDKLGKGFAEYKLNPAF